MNCPVCGASNAPDVKFCAGCGNPMPQQGAAPVSPTVPVTPTSYGTPNQQVPPTGYGAPVQPTGYGAPVQPTGYGAPAAPKAPKEKIDFVKVKDQLVETVKPVGKKAKDIWGNKKARLGIIGGAVALIALVVVFMIFFGGNGYIEAEESIRFLYKGNDEYAVVVGTKVVKDSVDDYDSISRTMNGKVMAYISESDLYVVKDSKVKSIADDVTSFRLSGNGEYVAYMTKSKSLHLAKTSDGKAEKIGDDLGEYSSFVISPDGKSVAYRDGDNLKLYRDKKSTKITSAESSSLYGLSNSGNQIYIATYKDGSSTLYSYNNKGEKTKLGDVSEVVAFNESFSQVLFYRDSKTYIAKDGKEATKISSSELTLVATERCSTHNGAYPVSNLFDHVYRNNEGDVYMVKDNKNNSAIKLVSKATNLQLDSSAKYLYYVYNYDELRVIEIAKGEKASESAKTIVHENVVDYVVTSDRKFVYFRDGDALKSVNGQNGGIVTEVADDLQGSYGEYLDFVISNKDRVYYIVDEDLYVVSNGKSGKKILSDANYVESTAHGDIYVRIDGAWYGSDGDETPKKLVDVD